ncbi:UNVERIFIED_CONTAM: hypothetical protein FKN15_070691 [Acipenser sinensis]
MLAGDRKHNRNKETLMYRSTALVYEVNCLSELQPCSRLSDTHYSICKTSPLMMFKTCNYRISNLCHPVTFGAQKWDNIVPEWEEPERPESKRGESVRPEPKRGESVRPEPKRGESVHPEPKRGKSVRPEPKRGKSVRPEPKRGKSVRPEPKRGKSVRPEPKRGKSVRPEPKRGKSVRPEPKRGKSVRPEPQQPLHMLLRGAQGRRTQLRRQKVPARLQRPLEWPQPPPPMPECLEPWPLEELELPLPEWPPSPSVVPEGLSAVPEGSSSPPVVPECLPAVREGLPFPPPTAEGDELLFPPPPFLSWLTFQFGF